MKNKNIPIFLFLLLGLAVCFCFSFTGNEKKVQEEGLHVVCMTYPISLFATALLDGTGVKAELLLPADTGCPHDYSLTPGDLMKISGRNVLLLRNGLGLDDQLCKAAESTNPELRSTDLSAGVDVIAISCGEEKHSSEHHHHDAKYNTHIFASPDTALQMVRNLERALTEAFPEHAEKIAVNSGEYQKKLELLADEFRNAGLSGKKIAVQHDVFGYLARLCGIEEAVSLHADENQIPSPAEVVKIKNGIAEKGVKVLFAEPQYPRDAAVLIAKECGIPYAVLDPCATGPEPPDPDCYFHAMRENLRILKEYLIK